MPRRKREQPSLSVDEPILALPAPRVVTKHEHAKDPYETPPGAVPAKVSNVETSRKPITRKQTKQDELAREEARRDARIRGARYVAYLDVMTANGGDQIEALAHAYNLGLDEVRARREELLADVRTGIGSTDLGDVLEHNDLGLNSRARILRKWMYSDNPGASLKAADMINELEGTGGGQGSFESFLRLSKEQRRH